MKLASFRLRVALLSAALAGSTLVGFSLVAWRLIYVAKVSSLDAKLKSQLQQLIPARATKAVLTRTPDWWQTYTQELPKELETQVNIPISLLMLDDQGHTVHYAVNGAQLGAATLDMDTLMNDAAIELIARQQKSLAEEASQQNAEKSVMMIFPTRTQGENWRIGVVRSGAGQGAIAVSLQTIDDDMAIIRNIFLFAIPSTLLMISVGAWILSGSALRPVHKLTSVIQQVTATGLDQQVPVGSADIEFVELIEVFNQMLRRLERSFRQSSRFSGDAAHELKTPLAILRGELELAMQKAEPGSEVQQILSKLMDEVSRLSTIVRKLLLLSLADAGQMSLKQDTVDLGSILSVLLEDVELLDADLPVSAQLDQGLKVKGDRDLLTQVLQNLVDNAVKYNLPAASAERLLAVDGEQNGRDVTITVTNASQTIPEQERDRIFDRFYRGDLSRNRKREGFGLGLSLAREIARAHRGDLKLEQTPPGKTAFTLTLPTA